ncbi:MAG: ribosomal-processing cysteine protease Prp [Blautia sp.]|nr:ribosomal-processing cysteine protease Prp [Lachnoclostridium sp.]MCM1210864.1 ribosomal-processing cysteine protease Prp [Blautia sp.]
MTTVTFHKTKSGDYKDFICSGHAGFDNYGKDIVCASISILVINTINSLEEITKEKIVVETDEEKGLIVCRFESTLQDTSKALVDSLVLGLSGIVKQYGKKYCKLKFEEV